MQRNEVKHQRRPKNGRLKEYYNYSVHDPARQAAIDTLIEASQPQETREIPIEK